MISRFEKRVLTIQKQWDELAQSPTLGFANEQEMFKYLAIDQNDKAIADLLGYFVNTIRRRRTKCGIKPAYGSRGDWRKRRKIHG